MNRLPIHITAFYEGLALQAKHIRAQDNLKAIADALESPIEQHGPVVGAAVMSEKPYQSLVHDAANILRDIDQDYKDFADKFEEAAKRGLREAKAFYGVTDEN